MENCLSVGHKGFLVHNGSAFITCLWLYLQKYINFKSKLVYLIACKQYFSEVSNKKSLHFLLSHKLFISYLIFILNI